MKYKTAMMVQYCHEVACHSIFYPGIYVNGIYECGAIINSKPVVSLLGWGSLNRVVCKWWCGAISPPTYAICATYFLPFFNILTSNPINNQSISPCTLANAPPTPKVTDNPALRTSYVTGGSETSAPFGQLASVPLPYVLYVYLTKISYLRIAESQASVDSTNGDSVSQGKVKSPTLKVSLLTMKRQWTYGPT